jgi:hypothetical protein
MSGFVIIDSTFTIACAVVNIFSSRGERRQSFFFIAGLVATSIQPQRRFLF